MRLSTEEFAGRFGDSFTKSAFRFEMRDNYVAANETEPFRRFLLGELPDPAWRDPWKAFVRDVVASGRVIGRIHVVTEPLTAYVEFELMCAYPANVEAGEEVWILPRAAAAGLDLPAHDVWLLDDAVAALMEYDEAGNWLSVELTTDSRVIADVLYGRDAAMALAVPLNTYLDDHRESTHGCRAF